MSRLSFEHVNVRLGGRTLIAGASAAFEEARVHAVVGRSGAGKSVLMKSVMGLLPMESGEVHLDGGEAALLARAGDDDAFAALRRRAVFVHQDPALLDDLSVGENIDFVLHRRSPLPAAERRALRDDWVRRLDLGDLLPRRPRELGDGPLRRVALGRALCLEPEVLIVDEPTTGLDPVAAREVDDALAALAGGGSTLIVITHDLRSLERLRPSLTWVHEGRVAFHGPYADEPPVEHPALRALLEGRAA
jgi:phospholipid/cholesterol/gamma-HCH transport system ATP-binding protein